MTDRLCRRIKDPIIEENKERVTIAFNIKCECNIPYFDQYLIGLDDKKPNWVDHIMSFRCIDKSTLLIVSPYNSAYEPASVPDYFHKILPIYRTDCDSYVCQYYHHGKKIRFVESLPKGY